MPPSIGIIGAGRVGQTLARAWAGAGYDVVAVTSRTATTAEALATQVNALVMSAESVLLQADLTLLSVPDDVIAPLAKTLAAVLKGHDLRGKGIIHASGVYNYDVLAPLAALGMYTGSLHPALPFADVELALKALAGTTFAVEAEHELLRHWLGTLVTVLGGHVLRVPSAGKAAYHAALVMVSNYTVTLYAAAQRILLAMGGTQAAVDGALMALMTATVENIGKQGMPDALTGPLTRADLGTIEKHLAVVQDDDVLLSAYVALARLTIPLLRARGVPEEFYDQLEDLFEITNAIDDTRYSEDEGQW